MEIPLLNRSSVPTPTSGNGYLFFDISNANALTVKFTDCTFKVLSAEPYQVTPSQSLLDAQADFLDGLKCALKNGQLTAAEYTTLMTTFQLYYQSNIDLNGNLNQSITTSPQAVVNEDFGIGSFSPTTFFGDRMYLNFVTTVKGSEGMFLEVDRMGGSGDMTVSFISPDPAITLKAISVVSNSLGVATISSPNIILDGTSKLFGEFIYDGTAISAGTYTGVVVITRGSVNKFIGVQIVITI